MAVLLTCFIIMMILTVHETVSNTTINVALVIGALTIPTVFIMVIVSVFFDVKKIKHVNVLKNVKIIDSQICRINTSNDLICLSSESNENLTKYKYKIKSNMLDQIYVITYQLETPCGGKIRTETGISDELPISK